MKTTIFSSLLLLSALCSYAVEPDTIMTVNNPNFIVVTENASGMKVSVEGTASDSTFQTTYSKAYNDRTLIRSSHSQKPSLLLSGGSSVNQWSVVLGSFCFGFVDAAGTSAFSNEMGKSLDISLVEAVNVGYDYRNTRISLGLGFGWRNWRMTEETRFIAVDGFIATGSFPDGVAPKYSRINMFSLSFPVMIRQELPFMAPWGTTAIKAGVVLNWNSHASMKTAWTNAESNVVTQSTDKIGHRKFSTDLLGMIGFNSSIGVYVRYSLQSVFKKGYGPDFNAFSTGIVIGI